MTDAWAAYCFDQAVAYVGAVIDNASQELENVGTDERPDWRRKYSLAQLLDPAFSLTDADDQAGQLRNVEGMVYDEVS